MKNYNNLPDINLINIYKSENSPESLEILLKRYDNLLNKLAHNHTVRFTSTQFDDNKQNAILGAIIAIKAFRDQGTKLSTYLYKSVYMYLLTSNDEESFVRCPSNARKNRLQYDSLKPITIAEFLPDQLFSSENEIISGVSLNMFIDSLPDDLKKIAYLKVEGYDNEKIARKLSTTGKQIKKQVELIQNIFLV
jgi:RNA polymerase sigma factor (sigma-70 family)